MANDFGLLGSIVNQIQCKPQLELNQVINVNGININIINCKIRPFGGNSVCGFSSMICIPKEIFAPVQTWNFEW